MNWPRTLRLLAAMAVGLTLATAGVACRKSVPVPPANQAAAPGMTTRPGTVLVSVTSSGDYQVGTKLIKAGDDAGLAGALTSVGGLDRPVIVVIQAGGNVQWKAIRPILKACVRSHLTNMEFRTSDGAVAYRFPHIPPDMPEPLDVTLRKQSGGMEIQVAASSLPYHGLPEALDTIIKAYGNERMVAIACDDELEWEKVVSVIDMVISSGLQNVGIRPDPPGPQSEWKPKDSSGGWTTRPAEATTRLFHRDWSSRVPGTNFWGLTGKGHNVVYCVQASGELLDNFDIIRVEMVKALSRLGSDQNFHMLVFTDTEIKENPPKKLVQATDQAKIETSEFLKTIQARGQTPEPQGAIKRAFEVLKDAPAGKANCIYLLTTGRFTDRDALTKLLAQLNKDKRVQVNILLYDNKDAQVEVFLQGLAADNGGKYKRVERQ